MNHYGRRQGKKRRIFGITIIMSAVLALFVLRIAWLQLMPAAPASLVSSGMKREAVAQRERALVLDSGRGDFVDRSGLALTGDTYEALAVFPLQASYRRGSAAELGKLAGALGVPLGALERWMRGLTAPAFWQAEGELAPHRLSVRELRQIDPLHIAGVRVLPYRSRYPSAFEPKHAIGYISQHPELLQTQFAKELTSRKMKLTDRIGGSGLERSLDRLLRGTGPTSVSYFTDGADKPLNGLDMRLVSPDNPYYPLKVVTTLELPLQNAIERYVDANGLKQGAVVVLDARTGDIAAMVSRPRLDVHALGAGGTDLANHAVRAATPGSVFKLVTEAAALEAGLTDEEETFDCKGDYGRYGLHCWKEGGHGRLTLREAFAVSCNVAFAAVAERLSAEQLAVTADKLGIGRKIGWSDPEPFAPLGGPLRLLEEEEAGKVFDRLPDKRDGGQLAQTGIGQRDTAISPLQAANLVVTLLHDGRVTEPRLVSEIRYANGQRLASLPRLASPSRYGAIRPSTARALLRGMEAVVAEGTGRSIRQGAWAVAGKSGTAETVRAGAARNNQWFAGYGPLEAPRYAVAVLAENRPPGSGNKATALFRGVMDLIAAHEAAAAQGWHDSADAGPRR